MSDFNERSAYPSPEEFNVMRPEYLDMEDGYWRAQINIPPFKVSAESETKAGARRAALYEAQKEYRNYHPSYRLASPFPDEFEDASGTKWTRVPAAQRSKLGDYTFVSADGEDEDSADIEQMLTWDVRPAGEEAAAADASSDDEDDE
jgi:hypothetical protein